MKKSKREKDFDVIVCGGGAAGLSAALWCDDLKLRALLVEANQELGGQLLWTYNRIANHLGVEATDGRELRDVFLRQIEKRDFQLKCGGEISAIDFADKTVTLADGERFDADFLVVATGIRRRKLNVSGEERFANRGIIESGKREQKAVENKRAAIVGGGDAAFENALILAETAHRVFLIHRGDVFRARRDFVERVSSNPKIEILTETVVCSIAGGERIESLELESLRTKERFRLPTEALLIRIGVEPNSEIVRGKIDLDENGYVKIDAACETGIKDVFAVGDIANPLAPTVSGAVGMGATAVKAIKQKIENRNQ